MPVKSSRPPPHLSGGGEIKEFACPHKQYSVDTLDIIESEVSGRRIESKNCFMYL